MGGDDINNNESFIIKCKIDSSLNSALKTLLELNKITQQELLEKLLKEYVVSNLDVLFKVGNISK